MNPQPLVTGFLPENFRAKEMHCSSRDHDLTVAPRIWIRGVHRHRRVILSDSGTEQQRPILAKPERQPREKASVLVVEAEFTCAKCLDVTETVEHRESVALFQYPGTNLNAGR